MHPRPHRIDRPRIAALRDDLTSAGFTVAALDALWGEQAAAALFRGHRVPALRAVARREVGSLGAVAVLGNLFVLGVPVPVADLADAVPTLGVEGAVTLGLVDLQASGGAEGLVVPLLDLRPYAFADAHGHAEWWIASDLGELALGHAIAESHVLGVGGASATLAGLLIGAPVETALDLGTGCGIQAMHLSRHSARVLATDISARALWLAGLNAELNGIRTIDLRLGSLFEPVAGERFDQIASNPPFVITPRSEGVPAYEYRDGGMVGDALVAAVIRGVDDHLAPGGVAQLLGNWEYGSGDESDDGDGDGDGLDRVAAWLDETRLDAWIVEREVQDVAEYAETWIRDGGTRQGTADFDRLYAAWLDDFKARRVTRVGFGYILLRRPRQGPPTLRRLERLGGAISTDASLGVVLADMLAAHDWQRAFDDAALALVALTVAGDVTEERHYWPGDEHPTVMTLRQGGGFGRSVPLDTALAALVGACDGELSIAAIVAALAQLLEVDEQALAAELLPRIRELVVTGFLTVPGHRANPDTAATLAE